jgi:hypothetical protein
MKLNSAMSALVDQQAAFSAAILNPNLPVPEGLVGPDDCPSLKRFSVYRNNVVLGLVNALKDAYPAVQKIVGEEFFAAMARSFVAIAPPQTPMMFDYGASFPAFVESFPPATHLSYLADVARIERAWVESYHAADTAGLEVSTLRSVAPENFGALRFTLSPALRIVRSNFRSLSIWRMNCEQGEVTPIDYSACGEDALVMRPEAVVEVRLMPPGSAAFLQALDQGKTVNDALRAAGLETEGFDLSGLLAGMFESGGFVSWTLISGDGE